MVGLFALLGLRLWALQVLQAPAAAQAVVANQIRVVPVTPTRGLILDRNGNPLVDNLVTEQITLSRVVAEQDPAVIGRLAAAGRQTPAQVEAALNNQQYSLYKPVPVLSDAPLADIIYIKEHQSEFPGWPRCRRPSAPTRRASCPGPPRAAIRPPRCSAMSGPSTPPSCSRGRPRATWPATPSASPDSSTSTSPSCAASPGSQQLEVDPQGQVAGVLKSTRPTPGDDIVTNLDTNLQQVADNALATQIAALRKTYDPQCDNQCRAATRRPPAARWWS